VSAASATITRPPARSRRRAILLLLLLGATIVAAAILADPAERIRRGALAELSARGLRGEIADVSLTFLPGTIALREVRIFAAGGRGADPLAQADRVELSFAWLPLLVGRVELDRVDLLRPVIRLPIDHPAGVPPGAGPPRPGPAWRIVLDRLRVDDGAVRIGAESWPIQGEVRQLDVDAEVDLAQGRGRARAFGRVARLQLRRGVEIDGRLDGRGAWTENELRVDLLRFVSAYSSAELSGTVTLASPPTYRFEGSARVPLERVARTFGGESWASGPIEGNGTIVGEGSHPTILLDLVSPALRVHDVDVGAARGQLRWTGSDLSLEGFAGEVLGGSVEARYHGTRQPAGWAHRFDLKPSGVEVAPALAAAGLPLVPWRSLATGAIAIARRAGATRWTTEGEVALRAPLSNSSAAMALTLAGEGRWRSDGDEATGAFTLGGMGFTLGIDGTWRPGGSKLQFDLGTDSPTAFLREAIAPALTLIEETTELPDLSALAGNLRLSGRLQQLRGEWSGDGDLQATGLSWADLGLGDLRARIALGADELAFEGVTIAGDLLTGGGRATIRLRPQERGEIAAEGHIESLDLARASAWANRTDLGLSGQAAGEFHLQGSWRAPIGEVAASAAQLDIHGLRVTEAEGRLQIALGQWTIEHAAANLAAGRLQLAGVVPRTPETALDLRLTLEGLAPAELPGASAIGLAGSVAGEATVHGTLASPVVEARAEWQGAKVGDHDIGVVRASAIGPASDLPVDLEASAWGVQGHGTLGLGRDLPLQFSFVGEQIDLARLAAPYLPRGLALTARGDVRGALFGPLLAPELLRSEVQALNLEGSIAGLPWRGGGPVSIGWADGVAVLRPCRLLGPETDLIVSGRFVRGQASEFEGSLRGTVGLGLLTAFDPKLRLSGVATVEAEARPVDGKPEYLGTVEFDRAQVGYEGMPMSFDSVAGRAVFAGDELRVESLTGRLGGGKVRGSGKVRFAGIAPKEVRLVLDGEMVTATYPQNLRTVGDFHLTLEDVPGGYRLAGGLQVARGEYRVPLEGGSGLVPLRTRAVGVSGGTVEATGGLGERVALDIHLTAPDSLFLRSEQTNIETQADLTLGGTLSTPQISGVITALEGGVVYFRDVRYRITGGTVSFAEYGEIDPVFHLEASTTVREWEVELLIDGRVGALTYELRSYPPLPQEEILSLLITGRTPEEVRDQGGTPLAPEEVANYLYGPVNALLDQGVAKTLGLTQVRLDSYTLSGAADPSARVTLVKDVTPSLRVTFSTGLESAGAQVYQVQYQATPKIEVLASRDEESTFGGDFRYTTRGYTFPRPAAIETTAPPIGAVAIVGAPAAEQERLERALRVEKGDRYRRSSLIDAAERLRRRLLDAGYFQAQVEEVPDPHEDRVDMRFEVTAGRRYELRFAGADDSRRLRRVWREALLAALVPEEAIEQGAAAIAADFRERGYPEARCEARVDLTSSDEGAVTLAVDPGARVQVRAIEVIGEAAITENEIRKQMLTREDGAFTRGWFRPQVLEADLEAIRALYRDRGYQAAAIPPAEVEIDRERGEATVRVRIDEGRKWTVEQVDFEGNEVLGDSALLEVLALAQGQALTRSGLDASRAALRRAYDQIGHDQARVLYRISGEDPTARRVTFEIVEGPFHQVGPIQVAGNSHTRSRVIRRNLSLETGQPLRAEDLLESQRRLARLGIFRSVDVRAAGNPADPLQPVVVNVIEAPNLQTSFGVGYDTDQGARGFVQVADTNFLGRGQRLGGLARASAPNQRAELFFAEPHLFGRPIEGFLNAFWSYQEEESFDETRTGITVRGSRRFHANTFQARYRLEDVALDNVQVTTIDPDEKVEDVRLGSLGGSLVRNLLDDPLNPRRGFLLTADLSVFHPYLASEETFVKLFSGVSVFRPLPRGLVWAQALRIGLAEPFNGSEVPLSERFFAGGDTTIRGFKRDQVGPLDPVTGSPTGGEAMLILNEELRFPIWKHVGGTLFYDAGNVYEDIRAIQLSDVRTVLGIGARYETPIGPIRLEYGWKLDRRPDEAPGEFFFSLGRAF
jgi:outer membrane protein assembly complex protein YaeT